MSDKKLAIKLSTLKGIGNAIREKEGSTDAIPVNALADRIGALQIASGENKLSQLVDGTLTEITAEDLKGATKIRADMFYNMPSLERVSLPNTITEIGDYAFGGSLNTHAPKITNIVFPNSIIKLGKYQHHQGIYLQSVTLPQNAQFTDIPLSIFFGCSALDNVVIPDNVERISNNAFRYCNSLTNITISDNVYYIGEGAFRNCENLTDIIIPNRVSTISDYALQIGSSTNKATITFLRTTPPSIQFNTFNANYLNKIIVPAGCGEAYKSATNWANFADYIEEATE